MIKHLFKLVWNRKRSNFLITLEIFVSFLVLFGVVLFAVYYIDNYRNPLGFEYRDVWAIAIDRGYERGSAQPTSEELRTINEQLVIAARQFEEVQGVAESDNSPYSFSSSNSLYDPEGKRLMYGFECASDEFADVLGLTLVEGRWFSKEDNGAGWSPVVINLRLSREIFGTEDPIGKPFWPPGQTTTLRVIGVISDFRREGEFAGLGNYQFERRTLADETPWAMNYILIKVKPGTTAAFEEKLVQHLQAVAKDWSFEVEPLSAMRDTILSFNLALVISAGIVAGFLMIMVALGLMGVLWQSVTQRTKEIGLRRAKGATIQDIHKQILGELFVVTSSGLIAGTLLIVQFPLLDLIGFISARVYLLSLAASVLVIYALTFLCGLYPSLMATRVRPAEALHYE